MVLNVKNKIRLGTLFLFFLILVTGGVGIYFTAKLKSDSQAALKNNYESLMYAHIMQQQLNNMSLQNDEQLKELELALNRQSDNITEQGEKNATDAALKFFQRLKQGDTTRGNIRALQNEIQNILSLNMKALELKNTTAQQTANKALSYIITLAGIVLIISFTFIVNFPSVVTGPIHALSEAIAEVGAKNYEHRIRISNKDEFGQLANAFNEMAERLEYFESSNLNKLMFEKSRAEAVINSLKDASLGINKNNQILFANYQALQLLGMEADDVVGKSMEAVSRKNDLFRFLINTATSSPFKIVVDNKENYFIKETIDVEQGEEPNNKVIVLKNITSFKELDVAKTNFIATISHELKTPLASSDFSLRLLTDGRIGKLAPEQKELVESLKCDNQRMLKILSELLNLSQVETGRIQLNIQAVDPSRITRSALDAVEGSAKEKGVLIRENIEQGLPEVQADPDKTSWVLNNFLSNAIKNSPGDSLIEVSARRVNHVVVFSVKDQGCGIPQEYLPRLFEKYFQVPGSVAKGTGLGLAISKEFVEAQNGKIWVESTVGHGANFSFELPVRS